MNLYLRYFDDETLVTSVDAAIDFLKSIDEIDVDPALEADIREYAASNVLYPKRYKIRSRVYFIIIKTVANTMQEFKEHRNQKKEGKDGEEVKVRPASAEILKLNEEKPGWYEGDMLFKPSWTPVLTRIQSAFLSDEEVERLVAEVKKMGEPDYIDDIIFHDDEEDMDLSFGGGGSMGGSNDNDANLFDKALAIVAETGKASASYLQRRLSIGYNRAARLIEDMEARGIIGPPNGSKPREILHMPDKFKE